MNIRKAAVAGSFYPPIADALRAMVQGFIDDASVEPAPERVAAIVAPHAGFIYSGATAGFAYKRVVGMNPKRVIVLAGSHRYRVERASVYTPGAFETPLGILSVDEPFATEFAKVAGSDSIEPHFDEHSLEVQLPFLQVALGEVPIVPVLFGGPARPWHAEIGGKLAAMVDDGDLVIASTDLSHFMTEEEANEIDKRTLDAVLARNVPGVIGGLRTKQYAMCGEAAVVAAMGYALKRGVGDSQVGGVTPPAWSLLDYRTSAAVSGDYNRVVGYGAISMERTA